MFSVVINGITDHIFRIMLERHHEIRKYPVYLSTSGIITFMAWNGVRFSFPVIMPDCPLAVIPEDESAFVADRTNEFTAAR